MNVAVRGYTSIADSQFDRAEGLQLQSAVACSRHVEASATTCVPSCATDLPAGQLLQNRVKPLAQK